MTTPAEAAAAIQARVTPLPAEIAPLNALPGAVLRESITALRDQPPFDRVMMDGIAVSSAAVAEGRREFRIAGIQAAGAQQMVLANHDACFEAMTGAVLPQGCDAVVPVERITIEDGVATIGPDVAVNPGLNIHPRGLDCRAGQSLLEPHSRIGAPELAVIASNGLMRVSISRRPRIMVISTGNELVEPGQPLSDWQIYRSNVYGVLTALQRRGYSELAHDHLPDDLDTLRSRLSSHLTTHDVLILSGGVSMGRFDYVPRALSELGVNMVFHKIEQRPGRPMWFGVSDTGKAVYALPGNPVSTLICLGRYVFAGLDAMTAATPEPVDQLPLAADFELRTPLTVFVPVKLNRGQGATTASARPTQGSGDFTSLIGTDGFVELPPGPGVTVAGTLVPFYRW